MKLSWKILIPAAIAIVLITLLVFVIPSFNPPSQKSPSLSQKTDEVVKVEAPKATGNVDDAIKAVEAFSTNEESEINAFSEDTVVTSYSEDLESTYGSVYDEAQF